MRSTVRLVILIWAGIAFPVALIGGDHYITLGITWESLGIQISDAWMSGPVVCGDPQDTSNTLSNQCILYDMAEDW